MGMFNYVKFSAPCRECGTVITDWQTKSSGESLSMSEVLPIDCQNFYTVCHQCETWLEYKVVPTAYELVEIKRVLPETRKEKKK